MSAPYHTSNRDNWSTPPGLFAGYNAAFRFTVDAAADESNHLLPRWFGPGGIEADGLTSWAGERVWCNPPYGRGTTARWVKHASHQHAIGCRMIVMLLPFRPATLWWDLVEVGASDVHIFSRRLRFSDGSHGAPFPSAIVIWRDEAGPPLRPRYVRVDPGSISLEP